MSTKKQILLVHLTHWLYALGFISFYLYSFFLDTLKTPFLFLAGGTIVSWIPFRGCPLSVWEDKLRRRLNLGVKQFPLITFQYFIFKKLFKAHLPALTLYLIVVLMIVRVVW